MQSKAIEYAIFYLPIIGTGVFLSFAGNAYYSGHKSHALWLSFGAVVCFLLLATIQIQKAIWDGEQGTDLSPTERPWVEIRNVVAASPLSYDDKGWSAGVRWHVIIQYELRNTGKTPAIDTEIFADMVPFMFSLANPQGLPEPGTDVEAELKRVCAGALNLRENLPPLSPVTLYPDSAPTVRQFILNGNPAIFEKAKALPSYGGNFVVLLCVTYKFATGTKFHQTGSAYAMFKPVGKIDIQGETAPANGIIIVPQPGVGGFTT